MQNVSYFNAIVKRCGLDPSSMAMMQYARKTALYSLALDFFGALTCLTSSKTIHSWGFAALGTSCFGALISALLFKSAIDTYKAEREEGELAIFQRESARLVGNLTVMIRGAFGGVH